MHSSQHYRMRAQEVRRLAAAVTDREIARQLEGVAQEYEQIADSLERRGSESSASEN